jgi:protein-S-isoprenylcysteine O-methyltransferase Ste14
MSPKLYGWLVGAPWIAWLIYWWLTSLKVKAVARQESVASRLSHVVPVIVGALIIAQPRMVQGVLAEPIWPPNIATEIVGFIVMLAGLGFSVWARRHIGANWSATVTVKEGHELVRTGPYAIVRHPIYTGLLAAFFGMAIIVDAWKVEIGLPLIAFAFIRKLRIEEGYMAAQFGSAYDDYKRHVRALIPGVF